jgi:hypothetical protein
VSHGLLVRHRNVVFLWRTLPGAPQNYFLWRTASWCATELHPTYKGFPTSGETVKQIKNPKIEKFKKIQNNLKLFLKIFKNNKMTLPTGTKGFSNPQRSGQPRGEPLVPGCDTTGTKEEDL